MKTLRVKKLSEHATLPTRAHEFDAGLDLYASEDVFITLGSTVKVSTGIAINVSEGYFAKIEDRSGMASKGLRTGAGIVDFGYNGEVLVVIHNLSYRGEFGGYMVRKGDRVAQLLLHKIELPQVLEVSSFSDSDRGEGAFGSSGR